MTFRRMLPEPFLSTGYPVCSGACISPNSRFLYYNNHERLMQFDLEESNLSNPNSQPIEIAVFSKDSVSEFGTIFYQMRNAPDGKIYMNCPNGTFSLHVINKPDLAGKDCAFKFRGVKLPRYNAWIWSDFPNFNLGKKLDSPCDTITTAVSDQYEINESFKITPNPASNATIIELPTFSNIARLTVFDPLGNILFDVRTKEKSLAVDVSSFPQGPFFVQAVIDDKQLFVRKMIVFRE